MISDVFVSQKVARLLRGTGFDEPCRAVISDEGRFSVISEGGKFSNSELKGFRKNPVACPTQQLAMRYLREVKGLFVEVNIDYEYVDTDWGPDNDDLRYFYKVQLHRIQKDKSVCNESFMDDIEEKEFDSYEDACEAGMIWLFENGKKKGWL